MENIVNTNNTNLRLCELRVGLFNTLRVSLPMVSPDATNVQVLLTNGTITTAYSAAKNTDGVWLCDVDAAQFSSFGKQKYEVAYKLDNKQFWDGQGWVNIVPATTSGIVPQPVPPPHRWAIISITQGDITHYADENGDINLDDITRVRWDNVIGKPDFAPVAESGSYNDLEDVPEEFPPEAHNHTNDSWFTTAIEAVKSWATNAFAAITHSHASDNWFTGALDGKLDKSGGTMTGNLEVTNSDGYPKVLVGDNNGDYAEYQKDGIFTNKGWIGFGAKNGTVAVEGDLSKKLDAGSTQSFNDSQKSKLSTNGGYRYKLVNATLTRDSAHTIPASGGGTQTIDCDYCSVSDFTITTIDCSSMQTNKLVVHLPTALDNRSRDLILKIKVSSSTPPTFYVVGTGSETVSFASDNEDWATLESGENVILLTETERSN